MTPSQIKSVLAEAEAQAGAIARGNPSSEEIRILSIAIAETARAAQAMLKTLT